MPAFFPSFILLFCGASLQIIISPFLFLPSERIKELVTEIVPYDSAQGDANTCSNLDDDSFDFVYSSHCLEHMYDPYVTFKNWLRICKSGGHIIVALPHEIFLKNVNGPARAMGSIKPLGL
jgi:ubiquinone/menaquinone biosynthesis C-methylase UbiE